MGTALRPEIVEPLLRGRLGRPYIHVARCPTTQELVRGLPEGAVAVAEQQTAGRGRHGRSWTGPSGTDLLLSISLRPAVAAERLPPLSLVIAEAVCSVAGDEALVRWPNDVVIGGRKLAGVIGELRDGQLVIGIGINVNRVPAELPAGARVPATSLRIERGEAIDRAALLADLLESIERRYDRFLSRGFEGLGRDELRGRLVSLAGEPRGRCEGVDQAGRLVVGGVAHSSAEVDRVDVAGEGPPRR